MLHVILKKLFHVDMKAIVHARQRKAGGGVRICPLIEESFLIDDDSFISRASGVDAPTVIEDENQFI